MAASKTSSAWKIFRYWWFHKCFLDVHQSRQIILTQSAEYPSGTLSKTMGPSIESQPAFQPAAHESAASRLLQSCGHDWAWPACPHQVLPNLVKASSSRYEARSMRRVPLLSSLLLIWAEPQPVIQKNLHQWPDVPQHLDRLSLRNIVHQWLKSRSWYKLNVSCLRFNKWPSCNRTAAQLIREPWLNVSKRRLCR